MGVVRSAVSDGSTRGGADGPNSAVIDNTTRAAGGGADWIQGGPIFCADVPVHGRCGTLMRRSIGRLTVLPRWRGCSHDRSVLGAVDEAVGHTRRCLDRRRWYPSGRTKVFTTLLMFPINFAQTWDHKSLMRAVLSGGDSSVSHPGSLHLHVPLSRSTGSSGFCERFSWNPVEAVRWHTRADRPSLACPMQRGCRRSREAAVSHVSVRDAGACIRLGRNV